METLLIYMLVVESSVYSVYSHKMASMRDYIAMGPSPRTHTQEQGSKCCPLTANHDTVSPEQHHSIVRDTTIKDGIAILHISSLNVHH